MASSKLPMLKEYITKEAGLSKRGDGLDPKAIVVPIIVEDQVIDVLSVQATDLVEEDILAITAVEHQVAGAWHKTRLLQDLRDGLEALQSTQTQLLRAQRLEAMGRLAGVIAHDFNNLLTVINGYSELMVDGLDGQDPLRDDAQEIRASGQRGANLTRQLLAFSRGQPMEMRVLGLNDVLGGMSRLQERVLGEDVALHLNLAEDLGRVSADPGQIESVVMNLAVNARDAMPQGGTLSVETANADMLDADAARHLDMEPGHYMLLSITDTGEGMTPEVMEHIFEPLFHDQGDGQGNWAGAGHRLWHCRPERRPDPRQ